MIKAAFHLLDVIKQYFSQEVLQMMKWIKIVCCYVGAIWLVAENAVIQSRKIIFRQLCLAGVKVHNISPSCRSRDYFCPHYELICDNKHQQLPLGSFLKAYREEHLVDARSYGVSTKPTFSRSCCIKCSSICQFKFDQ